jgi:hypothetical protein
MILYFLKPSQGTTVKAKVATLKSNSSMRPKLASISGLSSKIFSNIFLNLITASQPSSGEEASLA